MQKSIKITIVPEIEWCEEEFYPPANFFIVDALCNQIYIHTRSRSDAQEYVDKEYGKGKYTVRACKLSKGSGEITARGSVNSRSRAGTYMVNIRNKQGF